MAASAPFRCLREVSDAWNRLKRSLSRSHVGIENHMVCLEQCTHWYSSYDNLKYFSVAILSILSEEVNRSEIFDRNSGAAIALFRRRQENSPMSASASETKTPILRKSKWTKHSVQLVPQERGRAETSQSTSLVRDHLLRGIKVVVDRRRAIQGCCLCQ